MLINLAASAELFHTATGTAYADLVIDGHRETWPVRSPRFRGLVAAPLLSRRPGTRRAQRRSTPRSICSRRGRSSMAPSGRSMSASPSTTATSISILPTRPGVRSTSDPTDGAWLGSRRCASAGRPACCRCRSRSAGGSLDAAYVVPQSAGTETILSWSATWLLATLRHGGPYPLLVISGEQGSAKTVLSKMLRALVDPNAAPVRTLPREERDLFIAANNGHVLAFDNVSALPSWLSDTLCRLASGGSFAVRQLYTDQDEVLFDAARPIILNGIEDVVTRPDLADRGLFVTLRSISEAQRRPEKELWREFELARPRLLGALLDAVSHGLRMRPQLRLDRLPRMADFALWAAACETALWPAGTFARAYAANRRAAVEDAIDADPVAACVRELMAERSSWTGSAADLLRADADCRNAFSRSRPGWPKNPRALAGRLRRAQTSLRTGHRDCLQSRRTGREPHHQNEQDFEVPSAPSAPAAASSTVWTFLPRFNHRRRARLPVNKGIIMSAGRCPIQ